MNNFLKKDLKTKIIAVFIAIIFWLFVSNVTNPFDTKTIYNVPITLENEDYLREHGFVIRDGYIKSIDITIRGRRDAIDKVRTSDFETVLDFSQIKTVNDKKLVLSEPVCSLKNITIESFSPTIIGVNLTRNSSRTFQVELNSNVTMKPGYVLLNTTLSPESMPIFGEESLIDSVSSVKALLEVKDLDRDKAMQLQCKVYNKAGEEISSLSSDFIVNVMLEVAKEVPVSLVTKGRLAADHIETLRVIEPVKVLIKGPAEKLAAIDEIKTEPVNIDKLIENYTATIPLVVPEGVRLVDSPENIAVNINVEKLALRDIELKKDDISILNARNDGTLQYEVKTEKLVLQLKGRKNDINAIRLDNLNAAVDVKDLPEGAYTLPLNISVPPQINLMQKHNVEVVIKKIVDNSGGTGDHDLPDPPETPGTAPGNT